MQPEASREPSVDAERLRQTVCHLYESNQKNPGFQLSTDCEFHDPIVIVRSAQQVSSMFSKLNRMFPASTVEIFEPVKGTAAKYELSVHYRRSTLHAPTIFYTEIEFAFHGNEIIQITEDWRRPMRLSGRGTSPMSRWFRMGLGRLMS